jgi:hypothetical protein
MPFPKFTKYFPGNYPQLLIIAKDNKSSHNGRFNFELPDYQRFWCMTPNVKALGMWVEFMAVSARLPMLGKDKNYQVSANAK